MAVVSRHILSWIDPVPRIRSGRGPRARERRPPDSCRVRAPLRGDARDQEGRADRRGGLRGFPRAPPTAWQAASAHLNDLDWRSTSAGTPGVEGGDNGSIRLDLDNMPQPDAYLMIDPQHGGRATISDDDYVEGAPELVAEITASSVSYDLGKKLQVYRRNGVREYIVWRVQDQQIDWFVLREGQYAPLVRGPTASCAARSFPACGSTSPRS